MKWFSPKLWIQIKELLEKHVPATILLRNYRLLGADDIFYNRQGKYGVTLEGKVGDIVLKDKTIYFRFKL